MKPYEKRRVVRFAVDVLTFAVLITFAPWWVFPLVLAYGMWSFYDGITTMNIIADDELKARRAA